MVVNTHNKNKVLDYFKSKDSAYPSDVARDLKIDLREVVRIISILIKEGNLEPLGADDND